jgi:uncharacterized repeat protein (TIGR03803 family)
MLLLVGAAEAQTYNMIHSFTGASDGAIPIAAPTMDQFGNFYGTSSAGGSTAPLCLQNSGSGCGTVWELKKHGAQWVLQSLYQFAGNPDGSTPLGRVVVGPDGSLYGTTQLGGGGPCSGVYSPGCGIIFNLRPPAATCPTSNCSWKETILHTFNVTDGAYPWAGIVFDQQGNFYGTTAQGGLNGYGVVFKMTRSGGSWSYSVIHSFNPAHCGFLPTPSRVPTSYPALSDGCYPSGDLLVDSNGNIFGTTQQGGEHGAGAVFKLTHSGSGWTESIVYSLGDLFQDGGGIYGGLIADSAGNFFGSTMEGGSNGNGGTVFQLSAAQGGWNFSVLANLPCGDCYPYGNPGSFSTLAADRAGNLYGTTVGDGSMGEGTMFKLVPTDGGYSYLLLHDCTTIDQGRNPYSGMVLDHDGNLWGTTGFGGTGDGDIYEITP